MGISVALIGAGNIARKGHVPGLLAAGARIVAVCDSSVDAAKALAAELGHASVFLDYREMLATVRPEAVTIAIPNAMHAGAAIAALEAGAHVLCEKPLATNLAYAEAIVKTAAKADRVIALNLHFRLRPEFQLLKRMINQGDMGKIFRIVAKLMRRSGIPGYGSWFTRHELAGGGAFTDLGAHLVDLVVWLLDFPPVKEVQAQFAAILGPRRLGLGDWGFHADQGVFDVEDFASVRLETGDGCVITIETSWAYFGPDESRLQVLGSSGGVDVCDSSGGKQSPLSAYALIDGEVRQTVKELPFSSILPSTTSDREWRLSMQQFVDACGGRPGVATGAEALRSMEILDRAYADGLKSRVTS